MVNEWRRRILIETDRSCHHCGLMLVELCGTNFLVVYWVHMFWHYAANIVLQLFAKKRNLGPQKSFSMMQCLFDWPFNNSLKPFSCI